MVSLYKLVFPRLSLLTTTEHSSRPPPPRINSAILVFPSIFLIICLSMAEVTSNKKRLREDSAESEFDLPEVKRLRDDFLSGFLDETFPDPETQDLDSVMMSFQQEISTRSSPAAVEVVDLTSSDSSEFRTDLGYLLEASDDELGLPPSTVSCQEAKSEEFTELVRLSSSASSGIGEFWGFDENVPSYDSFELGIGEINGNISEYVGFDEGLFEYSNVYFDSAGIADLQWRHETFPAE